MLDGCLGDTELLKLDISMKRRSNIGFTRTEEGEKKKRRTVRDFMISFAGDKSKNNFSVKLNGRN
jgi:hypothetical protein